MRTLDTQEIDSLARLNRIKAMATAVLVACFVTLIVTKLLEPQFPWLAIVTAFAEAATIGGIADWYAVVALFKRPLNLPFPHTAIIPNNQPRIADNLGRFIESNFLARAPVEAKLREIDFASEISGWLSARARSGNLARMIVRFVPELLRTVDEEGLVRFATGKVSTQLAQTDVAPLVSGVLTSLTQEGRHQALLDEIIKALHHFLKDEETLDVIRGKVQKELPTLLYIFQADNVILRRLMTATTELLDEIKDDPDHPLRAEFEDFLKDYVTRLRDSKGFATRVEEVKRQILERPEIEDAAQHVWMSLRGFLLEDAAREDSVLVARLTDLFVDVGRALETEPALRRDINEGMVLFISGLVEEQRGNISAYVAEQVRAWDMEQLLLLIEVNVGRDLQFIRFNGMIIGGCVGVILFLIERLLLP